MNDRSDEQLMLAYRRGDAAAFDTLYARHRGRVFGFLLRHSRRDRTEVEEVFQDSWLKVIRRRDSYDPAKPFLPWLFAIARNCMVDRWRHLGAVSNLHVSDDIAMQGASSNGLARPERRADSDGIRQRWEAAMEVLPAEQREALLLQLETGMTLEEIAAVTGTGRETVKSRLRYAMKKVRAELADLHAETFAETAHE